MAYLKHYDAFQTDADAPPGITCIIGVSTSMKRSLVKMREYLQRLWHEFQKSYAFLHSQLSQDNAYDI